jgi:uncharacterized delta-60 repeat protein
VPATTIAPDGALVVAGEIGTHGQTPTSLSHLHPAVTRLTPAGTVDRGFGDNGVATIPTAISASAYNVAIGPGGTLVVQGQSQAGPMYFGSNVVVARLTAGGVQDPAFNGGRTIELPFDTGGPMLVQDDGSLIVNGELRPVDPTAGLTGEVTAEMFAPSRQRLVRITPAGALDRSFGRGGVVDLGVDVTPQQLLPAGGRALLVSGTPTVTFVPWSPPVNGRIVVRRLAADGTADPAFGGLAGRTIDLPFGGGGSSYPRPRSLPSLAQNSFTGNLLVPRPDGSYVVAGGVGVHQPTGHDGELSIGRFALAALTPAFTLDTSFGAPATPLRLGIRLVGQRARTARGAHGIRVVVSSSAVGLARVKVLHDGRAIARSVLPVFKTTSHSLPVALTRYGDSYLARHRNVPVTVKATGRDLLTTTTTATVHGRLR